MDNWQTIGLWLLTLLYIFGIFSALNRVSKGRYMEEQNPTIGAMSAVVGMGIVVLLLTILL